ncbi:MAG: membrane dipeptidase [Clostridia bacterium]
MLNRVIFDSHVDTIEVALDEKSNLNNTNYSFNLKDALATLPYIQCIASFVNTKYKNGFLRVNDILDKLYIEYEINKDKMYLIKKSEDIKIHEDKVGIILTVENALAIEDDIQNIQRLYNRGVRLMSLTWNDDNLLGCGTNTKNDTGLTKFGKKCIEEMNRLNMIIDVSHASKKTYFDTINISKQTIVATHSCVYNICNHKRNLDDEQIKKIAKLNGVIGICFHTDFLNSNNHATSDDIVRHIEYIATLVGVDYIGLGSDFEGIEKSKLPLDILKCSNMNILIDKMHNRGFSNNEISKIMGQNFLRVFKENL